MMRKINRCGLVAGVVALCSCQALSAVEPVPSVAHGVVNQQKVTEESTAMQGIQSAISAKRDVFQKQILEQEKSLRADHEKLMAAQKNLPQKKFEAQQAAFHTKVEAVKKKVDVLRARLETAQFKAMTEFQKVFTEVVQKVAEDNKMSLISPTANFMWVDPATDVTRQVVDLLNTKLPKVEVVFASEKELGMTVSESSNPAKKSEDK